MKQIIDTHAHLYSDHFTEDLAEVVSRAKAMGITKVLMPNIDSDSIEVLHQVYLQYPEICLPMMGLHPCSVKENYLDELKLVEEWLFKSDDYVAVGEIGLDFYRDRSFMKEQKEAFRLQCQWSREKGLPVAIHSRDSNDALIELLAEEQVGDLKGVLHCFSGTRIQAESLVDLGFYLGVGGVSTFKNGGLDGVFPHIGLDKLIVETDSPYLAPVPFRGKRNEPAYIEHIVNRLSFLKGVSTSEVCRITTENAMSLFQL